MSPSEREDTVRTRILIISDTHNAALHPDDLEISNPDQKTVKPPFHHPLPSADLVIHCGDLTNTGRLSEHRSSIQLLSRLSAPLKIVIPGNHDLTLDETYLQTHLGTNNHLRPEEPSTEIQDQTSPVNLSPQLASSLLKEAHDLWSKAEQSNIVLLHREGPREFDLPNGARVRLWSSPYTPEYQDWAFAYARKGEDRFNPARSSFAGARNICTSPIASFDHTAEAGERPIDILITHGPPWGRLDSTVPSGEKAGCPYLLSALTRARPLVHCFGHIHEGWGAEIVRWRQPSATKEGSRMQGMSVEDFTASGGWDREFVEGVEKVEVDLEEVEARKGKFLDLSQEEGSEDSSGLRPQGGGEDGKRRLRRGEETLLVNAAVMDVDYRPVNGAWIVDLDLPRTRR